MTKRRLTSMLLLAAAARLIAAAPALRAQEPPAADQPAEKKAEYKAHLLGLPFLYYSPETKLAFGAGSILNFRAGRHKEVTRPSTIYAYASYNLAKQFTVLLKPEIYVRSNNLIFTGRLRYERTPQLFYGIGNATLAAAAESYTPRIFAVQIGVKRRIVAGLFGGFGFDYERVTIEKVDAGGLLDAGTITGSRGGLLAGFGGNLDWDTRDSVLFPLDGAYFQLSATAYGASAGSNFNFNRVELNLRRYFPMGVRSVLAVQTYVCSTGGDVPFYKLAMLGGDTLLRGYYKGRFRDKALALVQAEYRKLITARIGVVGFAGLADIFPGWKGLEDGKLKFAAGSGLRYVINKRDGTTVRLDMAWGQASFGLYITAQEAF
jgi:outer membrane protein assembly factor BamA